MIGDGKPLNTGGVALSNSESSLSFSSYQVEYLLRNANKEAEEGFESSVNDSLSEIDDASFEKWFEEAIRNN